MCLQLDSVLCESRTVFPTTSAQTQCWFYSRPSVTTWMDAWMHGRTDRQTHLERDREGLHSWNTLLALLSGDLTVEPHHGTLSLPFPQFPIFPLLPGLLVSHIWVGCLGAHRWEPRPELAPRAREPGFYEAMLVRGQSTLPPLWPPSTLQI